MRILRCLFWVLIGLLIVLIPVVLVRYAAKAAHLLASAGASEAWQRFVSIPLSAFSSLAVLIGGLVALCVWVWSIRQRHSEDLLKESESFFEKAFLTLNVLVDGHPENDRIRWLTSARLLKVAEQIGDKIELRSHKLIYEEIKEYWRSKFYDLVQPDGEGFPETYFAEQPEDLLDYTDRNSRAPLSLSSVAVIFRFTHWPQGRPDPIGNEPKFSEIEIHRMRTFGPRGLGRLMTRYHELLDEQAQRRT